MLVPSINLLKIKRFCQYDLVKGILRNQVIGAISFKSTNDWKQSKKWRFLERNLIYRGSMIKNNQYLIILITT